MTETLVRPLFPGPIDLVGDVHGELDALRQLLGRLGYAADGAHPQGRRLVFVGDLVDRGPDTPGVIELVRRLVEAGRAQCVLGNHEFNVLRGARKADNSWFFADAPALHHLGQPVPLKSAPAPSRPHILRFFASLPLALERDDVRVVHACWAPEAIAAVRRETDALGLYHRHRARIDEELRGRGADEIDAGLAHLNGNPVKLLTSGPERRTEVPFELNGRPRFEARVPWWDAYRDEQLCVFGHYWRAALPGEEAIERLFNGQAREATLGPGAAFCLDYSVGKRFRERLQPGFNGSYLTQLAALRLPERLLVFDNEDAPVPLRGLGAP
jgi:hypothetical protein